MRRTVLAIPIAAVPLIPAAAPKTVDIGDAYTILDAGDMGMKVVVR